MYMIDYIRNEGVSDCCQQSLEVHFKDKPEAKPLTNFLMYPLDMLFADKVILVEDYRKALVACSWKDVATPMKTVYQL